MRTQSLNHCIYQHQYHLVWATKYRRKWLKEYVKADLLESFLKTVKLHPTLHVFALNTDNDHLHLQIEIPPDMPVCEVVQLLKQNSSRAIKKRFAFIRRMYLEPSVWSVGYFSSTIGVNEEQIRRYIEYQGKNEKPKQIDLFS